LATLNASGEIRSILQKALSLRWLLVFKELLTGKMRFSSAVNMARIPMHCIPGQVWHITYEYYKREFYPLICRKLMKGQRK